MIGALVVTNFLIENNLYVMVVISHLYGLKFKFYLNKNSNHNISTNKNVKIKFTSTFFHTVISHQNLGKLC